MLKRIFTFLCLGFLLSGVSVALAYTSPGSPTGYVNDFAGIISDGVKSALAQKIDDFEKSTSNEISVVAIASLDGDYIENYAEKLFQEWGIGKKDKDNGVLLLVSRDDREVRIEVGYGLEGILTDYQSSRIISDIMVPSFKKENYEQGISDAVDKIMQITKNEFAYQEKEYSAWCGKDGCTAGDVVGFIVLIFIIFGLPLLWIISKKKGWGGGSGGSSSSSSDSWSSSSSSSDSSSSGSSFGGFGGGSSGGGGASGKW